MDVNKSDLMSNITYKLFNVQYAQATDEQKLGIRIDTSMFLTKRIVSTFEVVTHKYRDWETDRKSTRLNSSHRSLSRMPSSA